MTNHSGHEFMRLPLISFQIHYVCRECLTQISWEVTPEMAPMDISEIDTIVENTFNCRVDKVAMDFAEASQWITNNGVMR